MISFATSIWLWAIAGIIIPVAIHLWNVRKGKTLKVGSISFFNDTPVSRARSLRITDWLLLVLRCLIFMMLAFFIARPFIKSKQAAQEKGWLLIEKGSIHAAYQYYGQEIDSLIRHGFELHEFGGEFPLISLGDSSSTATKTAPGYWSMLAKLEQTMSTMVPVYLYTENLLTRFEGVRPELNMTLTWKLIPNNRAERWLHHVYLAPNDSVVVVLGESTANKTSFQKISSRFGDEINVRRDLLMVEFEGKSMPIDTATLRIAIYAQPGKNDGYYLSHAIEAAAEFLQRKIIIEVVGQANNPGNVDWLFWLMPEEMPAGVAAKKIFRYARGKDLQTHTAFALNDDQNIPVYRLVRDSARPQGQIARETLAGDPIMEIDSDKQEYKFYSRLNPQWNGLVWSSDFPQFVASLLFSGDREVWIDNRMIDANQAMPVMTKQQRTNSGFKTVDISKGFWVLGFLFFIIERFLVYRKQRMASGGTA